MSIVLAMMDSAIFRRMDLGLRRAFVLIPLLALMLGCGSQSSSSSLETDPLPGNDGDPIQEEDSVPPEILALEEAILIAINDERDLEGLLPLEGEDIAHRVARAHSRDMVERDFFDHTNPDDETPFDRLEEAGLSFVIAGENIAWNRGFERPADQAVDGWMGSDEHRANILYPNYTHTGVGVSQAEDGAFYFTQVFLLPSEVQVEGQVGTELPQDSSRGETQSHSSWRFDGN